MTSCSAPTTSAHGLQADLLQALERIAQEQDLPLHRAAQRYATASLPMRRQNHQGWGWHPAPGFRLKEN